MSVIRKRPFIEKILGDLPSSNDFNYLHHLLDTNVSEPTELSLIDSDKFPLYDVVVTELNNNADYMLVKTGIKSIDVGSVEDLIYNDDRSIFYTNLDGETAELKKGDSVGIIWYEDSERFSLAAGDDGINIDYDDIPFDKIRIKCNGQHHNVSSCSFFYGIDGNLTGPVTLANLELDANTKRTGFFIWGDNYVSFIAYHRFQDLELYEITKNADDELVGTYTKIKEYCDINELRRALDDYAENQVVHTIDTHTDNLFVMDELEVSEGCGLGENLTEKISSMAGGKHLHQLLVKAYVSSTVGWLYFSISLYLDSATKITTYTQFKNALTTEIRYPVSGSITGKSGYIYQPKYIVSQTYDQMTATCHRVSLSDTTNISYTEVSPDINWNSITVIDDKVD